MGALENKKEDESPVNRVESTASEWNSLRQQESSVGQNSETK